MMLRHNTQNHRQNADTDSEDIISSGIEKKRVIRGGYQRKLKSIIRWSVLLLRRGKEGRRSWHKVWIYLFLMMTLYFIASLGLEEKSPIVKTHPTLVCLSSPHCKTVTNNMLLPAYYEEKRQFLLRDDTDQFEVGDCKAMGNWQLESHPTCNMLHEVNDYLTTKLLSSGSYRDTWLIHWNGVEYALKTLTSEDDMKARNLERHRRDAIIMSMLSSSLHIPNIYAHCADSGIFEYSHRGNMETIIRNKHKTEREGMWSHEEMLRYSWQVSAALSMVHNVGNIYGFPAIAHTDIDIDQFLWIDGMFKLNDFNRARFIRWNVVEKKPCRFHIGSAPGSRRAPEEYIAASQETDAETLTPKVDVYSLGNIFYTILRKEKVFKRYSTKKAQQLVKTGQFPYISPDKISMFNEMENSIFQAMKMCHVFKEEDRSSAKDVEAYLRKEMKRFNITFL
jgi:hypothetical protein